MWIGILVAALLMVTMPVKCKIEEKGYRLANITLAHTSPFTDDAVFDFNTLESTSKMPVPTDFHFENENHPPKQKDQARNKDDMTNTIWPVKHAAEMVGDLLLGGLMMVHEREDSVTCGPIMPQGGIQALETMLYTLDVVNRMGVLPNITVGAHVLDDCDKDTYGLEMAVDFIKVLPKFTAFFAWPLPAALAAV